MLSILFLWLFSPSHAKKYRYFYVRLDSVGHIGHGIRNETVARTE
jgi:hypothetical protein